MQLLNKEFMKRATPEDIKHQLDSGADVNARDKHGATPLHFAVVFNKKHDVIKVLLNAGADANARCSADFNDGFPVKQMLAMQKKHERKKWWF
ncbi:MAG: hypothetical protein GDA50_00340 [Alphaproteobacteria bacterium GM202ARS2]|nr:hypothetical protein [Alphaproteobacteria bacterium GM202ARS2]